jgi:transcriptional regulator with XRE-family HTH domain
MAVEQQSPRFRAEGEPMTPEKSEAEAVEWCDLDALIGARLRARRMGLGKTEWDLGYDMGVSGSQVLAYETGASRLSASELWLAAQALDVPVAWFFEGADAPQTAGVAELTLQRLFARLPNELKAAVLDLVQSVVGEPDRSATVH